MVDAQDRDVEREGEGPCGGRDRPQARAEARPLRERHEIEVAQIEARDVHGFANQRDDPLRMVIRGLPGMDAALLRLHHVVHIGEDAARVIDDANPDGVGRPFNPERVQRTRYRL